MHQVTGRAVEAGFEVAEATHIARLPVVAHPTLAQRSDQGLYVGVGAGIVNYLNLHMRQTGVFGQHAAQRMAKNAAQLYTGIITDHCGRSADSGSGVM